MFRLVKCVFILCAALAVQAQVGDYDVEFHSFTRLNPQVSQPLLPTANSILSSFFDTTNPTIVTIHSFNDSVIGNFNAHVLPAHLAAQNVNVLVIDWSRVSGVYTQGLANAVAVAERIASFINFLGTTFSYGAQNFRIVGAGLGAHVAGITADRVSGVVPHVVGLDPSLFGWTHHPEILNPSQATSVEVIHSTAGILGYDYPLGTLDFYPNGGTYQLSCGIDVACSHTMAYVFYAESLTTPGGSRFVGTSCASYAEAIAESCSGPRDAIFGGVLNKSGLSGIYSFQTNWVQPYAQG